MIAILQLRLPPPPSSQSQEYSPPASVMNSALPDEARFVSEFSPATPRRSTSVSPRGRETDQTRLPTRVSNACERCRLHKSRCDEFRPCSICRRAHVECVSTSSTAAGNGRRPKKKRRVQDSRHEQAVVFASEPTERPSGDVNSVPLHRTDFHVPESDHSTHAPQASNNGSQPPTRAVPTPATVDYREAESIIGIARKIFQLRSQSLDKLTTSAIPDGGIPAEASNSGIATPRRLSILSVLGCSLPPVDVMRTLLEHYFESVHWFSVVIYEPTFRAQFESICDGCARTTQKPFLRLLSTVIGIGAWYCSKRPPSAFGEVNIDFSGWASKLIKHTESQLFEIINETVLASIQTCILLASYNSYHGQPKAAFALLGATIKTAQAMGLHRESLRGGIEDFEERKRAWWTIYTWDRWASITYGRPLGINDKDCNVPMPGDVYENRQFRATSTDHESEAICYSSYQRELNKLYLIASPMIETIFGIRSSSSFAEQRIGGTHWNLMKNVSKMLSEWRRKLPPQLVFDFDHDIALDASATLKAHQLQALALQLTFDHLVIIFYRPFLAQQVLGLSRGNMSADLSSQSSPPFSSDDQVYCSPDSLRAEELSSSEQWWGAAIRTSRVTHLPHIAHLATEGHLVAFLAINLFNAAVVMVVCALSNPLSDQAQEAKRNITRISRLQELLGKRSKLSLQSSVVLRKMIWIIVQREADAMLASIQPSREMGGDIANNEETQAPPYFSVEDALRLPLSMSADHVSQSRPSGTHQDGSGSAPDETARLNESLVSLQSAFPRSDLVAAQHGNASQVEQVTYNFDPSLNIDMLYNNFQYHDGDASGQSAYEFGGAGDDLYWIWNSVDSGYPSSL